MGQETSSESRSKARGPSQISQTVPGSRISEDDKRNYNDYLTNAP